MTHGWDLDATVWYYEKKHLAPPFRLILWDLPGLGLSSQPADGRYSLERFAQDLKKVIDVTAAGQPVVLLGHSIGGMTLLTFCRLFPEALGTTVSSLILVNTTHTMPLNTVWGGTLLRALQKPVLVPLLHLTIWLSPLVWAMNWLSYLNGSSHRTTNWTSFSGMESWGQLDFAARFTAKQSPGVLAKGILAMFVWDETATLPKIGVPTLVITGDHDKLTLPTAAEYMASTIPGSKLVRVASAGHTGFLEQSRAYDDAITNFLISQRLLRVETDSRAADVGSSSSARA
jgi:pimeloyl-ACP methyl ester carboxylesterase